MSITLLILFVASMGAACLPLLFKLHSEQKIQWLLAFSGAFLLGISLIHLLPHSLDQLGEKAGIYIFLGFFLQFIIQKFTHGVEHGHVHCHSGHEHNQNIWPIFIGLSVHAFMEGIPFGFDYSQQNHVQENLLFAVIAHRLPEAFMLGSLLWISNKTRALFLIIIFSLLSPLAGFLGGKIDFMQEIIVVIIPIVIGAFIHIATTILYESGTKHHQLSKQKISAIVVGILLALSSVYFHSH